MRWDQWLQGTLLSGLISACISGGAFFADGVITGKEGVMILGFFIGGVGLYLKDHRPKEE